MKPPLESSLQIESTNTINVIKIDQAKIQILIQQISENVMIIHSLKRD